MDSPSFPGVRTVYRKEILEGCLKEDNTKEVRMASHGFPHREDTFNTSAFCDCPQLGGILRIITVCIGFNGTLEDFMPTYSNISNFQRFS